MTMLAPKHDLLAERESGMLTPDEEETARALLEQLAVEAPVIDLEEEGWQVVRHPEEATRLTNILQNLVTYDNAREPLGSLMVGSGMDAAVVRMPYLHDGEDQMISFRMNEHVAVATAEGWIVHMHGVHEHDSIESLESAFWEQVADVNKGLSSLVEHLAEQPEYPSSEWMFDQQSAA